MYKIIFPTASLTNISSNFDFLILLIRNLSRFPCCYKSSAYKCDLYAHIFPLLITDSVSLGFILFVNIFLAWSLETLPKFWIIANIYIRTHTNTRTYLHTVLVLNEISYEVNFGKIDTFRILTSPILDCDLCLCFFKFSLNFFTVCSFLLRGLMFFIQS